MSKTKENELNSAVWLAQRATALMVAICFFGLPMFWLNLMFRFAALQLEFEAEQTEMMMGEEYSDPHDPWTIPTQLI